MKLIKAATIIIAGLSGGRVVRHALKAAVPESESVFGKAATWIGIFVVTSVTEAYIEKYVREQWSHMLKLKEKVDDKGPREAIMGEI